jgi:aspartokinase/homoserine dehydrogenase 1
MQVLKFGGTSVANAENISKTIKITLEALPKGRTVVVASAISKCTDALIKIAELASKNDKTYLELINDLEARHIQLINDLITETSTTHSELTCSSSFNSLREVCNGLSMVKELTPVVLDQIMSYGELLSTKIISDKLSAMNVSHEWLDSRQLIKTKLQYSQNTVDFKATEKLIRKAFEDSNKELFIMPGFIASDFSGKTTTLGRGGSDYTASIVAVCSDSQLLEIWTDVNGMMTADPRIVPEAKTITNISYKEALELSHFGAKVVYPPTIQPVISKEIPIAVKNTFDPYGEWTLIESRPPGSQDRVRGISSSNKIALLSIEGSGMVGIPGYSSKLFGALANKGVNIILITQASSVHTMCIAVDEKDAAISKEAIEEVFTYEISLGKLEPLKVETGNSIVSIVGDDMKNQAGTSGRMFDALGRAGINIRAIAQGSSERNVSAIISSKDIDEAIKTIHREFFGQKIKRINVIVAGYGNVGKEVVAIIQNQYKNILDKYNTDVRLVGVANSRRSLIDKAGLQKVSVELLEEKGIGYDIDDLVKKSILLSLKNTVFVDCTASEEVGKKYPELLRNGINVVASNKTANSGSLDSYKAIRAAAKIGTSFFFYETNVGAALPVISLIHQMTSSGDKIYSIDGLLSGTLNYLFSRYDGSKPFASLVREAKEAGYTEPDPRLDLSGKDVIRKCLILAREIGYDIEQNDIKAEGFLPPEFFKGSLEEFYGKLENYEEFFKKLYNESASKGEKLKFIASIENGTASVGIRSVGKEHPLYTIDEDNSVIIKSADYPRPLRIIGAGAGARQTATGVFNDILKINIIQ